MITIPKKKANPYNITQVDSVGNVGNTIKPQVTTPTVTTPTATTTKPITQLANPPATFSDYLSKYRSITGATPVEKEQTAYQRALDMYKNSQQQAIAGKQQAYNVNQNAIKYQQNTMNANGLGNTGQAIPQANAISNNYVNQLQQVDQAKATQEQNILSDYINVRDSIAQEQQALNAQKQNEALELAMMEMENNPFTSQQQVLDKYKDQLSESQYNQMQSYINQSDINTKLQDAIIKKVGEARQIDKSTPAVGIMDPNSTEFINWARSLGVAGSKNADSGQRAHLANIMRNAYNGKYKDYDVVNLNNGAGNKLHYIYYQGKFYKLIK